jgi:multidrug efflux pump subunit AcrB
MSLLGLSLVVGILVDDAIVVLLKHFTGIWKWVKQQSSCP